MIDILELRRELFHILVGIAFLLIILFAPFGEIFLFIVFILGLSLSFFSARYNIPVISKAMCLFERECNKKYPGKGVLFFFLGSLLALRLFERNIALASIMILTFADPVSHFVGSNFGKTPSSINRKKKIEGTISGILAGALFSLFFVHPLVGFAGSLIAMIVELMGFAVGNQAIDDNLLIPLVAGTVMHLLYIF